jgi:hypothetical protein
VFWFPNGNYLLVNSQSTNPDHGPLMGGPTGVVVYRIDRGEQRLADGRFVGETMGLIGWNVPGESFWSVGPGGQPESMRLDAAP